MEVERALECAVMAAEDRNPWAEDLKSLADEVKRLREQPSPRSMESAPRDGTWALVAVQVRPDKHRWRTAHYDVKLKSWIEGGSMVLRGLREPVAWLPHTPVPVELTTTTEEQAGETTAAGGSEDEYDA